MPRIYNRPQTQTPAAEPEHVALHQEPPAQPPPRPKAQPVTTPPVVVTTPEVQAILDRRAKESSLLLDAAEQVLTAIARGESPTAESQSLLVSMGFVAARRDAEVVRLKRVLSWQAKTGTAEERDQARQAAETAATELATRGPEIEQQIAALHRELAKLESEAAQTQKITEQQTAAVKSLRCRELLPVQLQQELDDAQIRHRDGYAARIRDLRGQIELTERLCAMKPPYNEATGYAEQLGLPCFQRVRTGHDSAVPTIVDVAGWNRHLDERRAADEALQPELERLEAEATPLIEKRETLLSFYVR